MIGDAVADVLGQARNTLARESRLTQTPEGNPTFSFNPTRPMAPLKVPQARRQPSYNLASQMRKTGQMAQ